MPPVEVVPEPGGVVAVEGVVGGWVVVVSVWVWVVEVDVVVVFWFVVVGVTAGDRVVSVPVPVAPLQRLSASERTVAAPWSRSDTSVGLIEAGRFAT